MVEWVTIRDNRRQMYYPLRLRASSTSSSRNGHRSSFAVTESVVSPSRGKWGRVRFSITCSFPTFPSV